MSLSHKHRNNHSHDHSHDHSQDCGEDGSPDHGGTPPAPKPVPARPSYQEATLGHPLEIIPLFRRWPPSRLRSFVYTAIFSSMIALAVACAETFLSRDGASLWINLAPMLLISNLIGVIVHGGMTLSNLVLGGWPYRAVGVRRLLFNVALVSVSVLLGMSLGNLLLGGRNVFRLLSRPDVVGQYLLVAAVVAVFMYVVRNAAQRRIALAVEEAARKELIASSARLLAEARLRALQAQIEPHFLYNTLANVVSLIGPKPAQAQHMLERFIDYLRASLAASRSEESTLGAEANLIGAYLDVLAVRMGERLRYRIELPDALLQFVIAPMLLQPVVENAIAHGLEPKVEGGQIVLRARAEGDLLILEISDTGAGLNEARPVKPGGGVGLSNLRERLRILYAGAARVELLENQPCGMTVRLLLPLNGRPTSTHPAP